MAPQSLSFTQQSPAAPPGTWELAAGHVMTLRPGQAGVLRVARGRLWATCDGPHAGPLNGLGDRILHAGDALRLRAGQRWVLEAWSRESAARFDWEPLPLRAPAPRRRARLAWRWLHPTT
jgi:hypothetical protein